ncbi:hypothetical protein L596_009843 [Steinernema carpocapsae]|uniref:Uncharacterized protein n=1 Tax=Steinernema carpocapsae TaxID=34508 RepID=A0A4U5PH15_STECR|nr:hypothetical protein L596_009843 [Steinernema carpocapsae]
MDAVPFAFIDSVAHHVSKASVILFSEFHSQLWSSVGATHLAKRVDFFLTVLVYSEGLQAYVQKKEIPVRRRMRRSMRPEPLTFETDRGDFDRITDICLFLDSSSERKQDRDDTETVERLINYYSINHLRLSSEIPAASLMTFGFLWEQDYQTIGTTNYFTCLSLLNYHLKENLKLEKVIVRRAKYDYMWKLTDAFKLGRNVPIRQEQQTGKRFRDLPDLGFQPSSMGETLMELKCENEVTKKVVTFVCSPN